MPGSNQHKTHPIKQHRRQQSTTNQLTPDQLENLAVQVASGRTGVLSELLPADQEKLICRTRELLRARLVNIIARTIALDIHRDSEREKERHGC